MQVSSFFRIQTNFAIILKADVIGHSRLASTFVRMTFCNLVLETRYSISFMPHPIIQIGEMKFKQVEGAEAVMKLWKYPGRMYVICQVSRKPG